jgi:hypothetical protein
MVRLVLTLLSSPTSSWLLGDAGHRGCRTFARPSSGSSDQHRGLETPEALGAPCLLCPTVLGADLATVTLICLYKLGLTGPTHRAARQSHLTDGHTESQRKESSQWHNELKAGQCHLSPLDASFQSMSKPCSKQVSYTYSGPQHTLP